jgi:hypothetical protein
VALVGWLTDAPAVDAGVPPLVRALLARALTRHYRVTFPYGEASETTLLRSTTDPQLAGELFDAPPFSWSAKAQFAVLSPLDAAPPRLSRALLERLLRREPIEPNAMAGASGMLVPAVDGDFAALIQFDGVLIDRLQSALAAECAGSGLSWDILPEAEFRAVNWM